jgi:hypothetical protein
MDELARYQLRHTPKYPVEFHRFAVSGSLAEVLPGAITAVNSMIALLLVTGGGRNDKPTIFAPRHCSI